MAVAAAVPTHGMGATERMGVITAVAVAVVAAVVVVVAAAVLVLMLVVVAVEVVVVAAVLLLPSASRLGLSSKCLGLKVSM
jgi:hypothetical protein